MAELIKISELAARAGVEKSTIQHYIREGLIPQPENRPHRNMHYYRADLVDRIKLIKDLQQRRNFPLSKIREVLADEHLADERGIEQIREYLYSSPAPLDLTHSKPISRAKLIEESGMEPDALDRLEQRAFITANRKGNTVTYDPIDAAIVHACASMRRAGLNETNGFGLDELSMYVVAMRELISKEMMLFARIVDTLPRESIVEMAQRGFEGTNTLILNIRRKLFLKVLGDARASLRFMEGKPNRPKRGQ
jgi:DNA-binding transcriptional MerR regulator